MAIVPATNEPMAAVASAGPARPRFAIWLPSIAVTIEARLARRVEQDRGGRAAVHGAVVDAGEHDERARRVHLNVTGSSSATVSAGPMPGSTPTRSRA